MDETQLKGVVDYHQTDDPVKAVLEIVDVVAIDPPIAVVTWLINSFNKVSYIRRKNNKDFSTFSSRFRSAAAENLQKTNVTPSSQVGQVLAIT